MNKLILGVFCAAMLTACSQDDFQEEVSTMQNDSSLATQLTTKDAQTKFAKILSKAVSNDANLRSFLKKEAMQQFDNDYDVFYPLSKDKIVYENLTFRDILQSYCQNPKELEEIEQVEPLLNILVPDLSMFWDFSAELWDAEDNEIVVISRADENATMYEDGDSIGNVPKGEIPGFPCLVIKDSERMKLVNKSSRSNTPEYVFANDAFDASKNVSIRKSRSSWDEDLESTENLNEPVLASVFKANIVEAWKEFKDVNEACQRDYLYYGINRDNKPGNLNRNIREELYRFRINPDAFNRIADQPDDDPGLQETSEKKRYLSKEEIIDRIWKDGNFEICFKSYVASKNNANNMEHKLVFSVKPTDLFSIEKVHIHHRHSTGFRHSKNYYSVSADNLRSKWFYPGRDSQNLVFLNPWDLYDLSVSIFLFVEEVDDTQTLETTRTVTNEFTNKADFSAGIDDVAGLKLNAKLGYGFSELHNESSQTKITTQVGSDDLGTLSFFFYDPIIRYQDGNGYQLMNSSSGDVQATILPRDLLVD